MKPTRTDWRDGRAPYFDAGHDEPERTRPSVWDWLCRLILLAAILYLGAHVYAAWAQGRLP